GLRNHRGCAALGKDADFRYRGVAAAVAGEPDSGALPAGWTPATAFARSHGTGFVHHQSAAHQILAVAHIDGPLGRGVIVNFHEPEAPDLAGEAVAHNHHRVHVDTCISKEILKIRLVRGVQQISYEKLLHRTLLTVTGNKLRSRR